MCPAACTCKFSLPPQAAITFAFGAHPSAPPSGVRAALACFTRLPASCRAPVRRFGLVRRLFVVYHIRGQSCAEQRNRASCGDAGISRLVPCCPWPRHALSAANRKNAPHPGGADISMSETCPRRPKSTNVSHFGAPDRGADISMSETCPRRPKSTTVSRFGAPPRGADISMSETCPRRPKSSNVSHFAPHPRGASRL